MKQIKLTTGEYLLVEVPEDAHSFEVYANNVVGGWCIMYLRGCPDYACNYSPNLPPGQWEIIGRASELPTIGSGDLLIAVVENHMNPETTLVIRKIK